jgi:hypothetical protein
MHKTVDHSYRAAIRQRERAIQVTENIAKARVLGLYIDASVRKRLASIAVIKRLGISKRVVRKDSIGWASTCGVLSAELAAIAAALTYTHRITSSRNSSWWCSQIASMRSVLYRLGTLLGQGEPDLPRSRKVQYHSVAQEWI